MPQPPEDRTRQRISRERGLDSHTLMLDLWAVKEQILDVVGICCLRSRNLAYLLPVPPSVLSIFQGLGESHGISHHLYPCNNPFYLPLTVVPTPSTTVVPSCSHLVRTGETNKPPYTSLFHKSLQALYPYQQKKKKSFYIHSVYQSTKSY